MADDAKLIAVIEANTKQFENALRRIESRTNQTFSRATKSVRQLDSTLKSSAASLVGIGKTFATAFGAGALVGGFAQLPRLIKDTVDQASGLVDLADRIGVTTDALQELRFQAEQNGSSMDELDAALEKFSKNVGLAASGSGKLLEVLTANGIALRDSQGNLRPLTDLLADYADLMKNAANEQDRAVLSLAAFDRAGASMASAFAGGSDEIERFREEAHRTNQVVEGEGLRSLEQFGDEVARMSGKWNQAWTTMTVRVLQALEQIGRIEHAILDPVIAAIQELMTLDTAQMEAELAKLEEAMAFLKEKIEVSGGFAPAFQAQMDSMIERAALLKKLLGEAAAIPALNNQTGGAGGVGVPRPTLGTTTIIPPGGRGGGAGGGGANEIKRQKEAVIELIEALEAERALIGLSETEQRIATETRRAGAVATEEQRAQIANLVTAIEAESLAYDQLIDNLDEVRSAAGGALSAFNDALRDGEGLVGGLKAALDRVLDSILNIAEEAAIFRLLGAQGTGGGGLLGGLFEGFFAHGGTLGAGHWGIAGERGPEIIRGPANVTPISPQAMQLSVRVEPSPLFVATVESRVRTGQRETMRAIPGVLNDINRRVA